MKKRLLCPKLPQPGASVPLDENEAHHATRVLRLQEGDTIEAMDGQGSKAWVTLRVRGGPPRIEYLPPEPSHGQNSIVTCQDKTAVLPVSLEMAVLKGEAMEWVVEKAVELGVKNLIPVLTAHTVVQMKSKPPESFQERWQKIADQALKQCGRLDRLKIDLPIPLESLLMKTAQNPSYNRLWCDESGPGKAPFLLECLQNNQNMTSNPLRILIGPEGGWSQNERSLLIQECTTSRCHRVHLGPLVLRAETAAIMTISVVTAFYRLQGSVA